MATQIFANSATGYLDTSITTSTTNIVLQTGQGELFPSPSDGNWFLVTLFDGDSTLEICKCTARSTDTLTLVRAQEDTTAFAFAAGSRCEISVTAGTLEGFVQRNATETLTNKTLTTPVLVGPNLGVPSEGVLFNCTTLPPAEVSDAPNTATGWFGVPAGTTAQRGEPGLGAIRYNTDTSSFEGYTELGWVDLGS
jgi:hypothetical protein